MNFDMAAEMCELEDIETRSIVGADDVLSSASVDTAAAWPASSSLQVRRRRRPRN